MKKVTILTQEKDAGQAIRRLRSIGVVHIEHQKAPAGKDIATIKEDIASLEKVIGILSAPEVQGTSGIKCAVGLRDWRFAAGHILDTCARRDHLEEYGRSLATSIAEWTPWGDFDPKAIQALGARDIFISLYQIPVGELEKLPREVIIKKLAVSQGVARCVVVSREKIVTLFKEIPLPKAGLNEMKEKFFENEGILNALRDTIRKYTCYLERFTQIRAAFDKELEFHEALQGMGGAQGITYIIGYIPADASAKLVESARAEQWGITVTEPSPEDAVPTLVRNPRWMSIINPVFKLLEIVPGYSELDISFWFLIFFSIFFGMLIGDAGDGAIFLILTAFAHFKLRKKVRDKAPFYLFYILSACAIIWGLLTGTIFGQAWLPQSVKPLLPALRNDRMVQELCFLIGAVHLSIAHLWRAALKAPSITALADIGWMSIIWGGFFLARLLILGERFPASAKWLFITGALLVAFFTAPRKNILKGFGAGMGALALNLVNSFTDVVSYIRLFAVGLAAVAIADAFNKMAIDVGFGNIFAGLTAAFILLIGHTLNIILGPMSVLVHGVRLNVLEFCGHLSISWSGFSYKPFKE